MQSDPRREQELFHLALEQPPERRTSFLEQACGQDAALLARVSALVAAHAASSEFLAEPITPSDRRAETTGALIGRYRLLEKIGEGGMGAIWMAEQREPVKRRVAIKIIKLGMDTGQVIARFEAERQALAMMDHPNIAKVFDAGATDSGRPYFVMEYIRGMPIVEFCDRERADTATRLGLFTAICNAIQHAHQKGIIHRDIKPSNVLVTLHDGVPVPKVIDFGIAKATDSELTARTLFTEHRQMIGTPAYMSPEQTEMSGLGIDTRSDVYSLGVLLYELLTGTTPFALDTLLPLGLDEMLRTIREVAPQLPSRRISTLGDSGPRTAERLRLDPKRLGMLLRGDLDWIVMKCLEKDRRRRYGSASELAADIDRHLGDQPVSAGPPSAAYRLHKFVRRHRGQVLAGAAVTVALLIGLVAFAWQAAIARDQRDQARTAQNAEAEQRRAAEEASVEARNQMRIAEAVAGFLTEMLEAADPDNLLGADVTVLEAIESAVQRLEDGSLSDQPLVEANVRQAVGRTLFQLGRYEAAEPQLRRSLHLFRDALTPEHASVRLNLTLLAMVLDQLDRRAEAEQLHREAVRFTREALPVGHRDIGTALNNLGLVLHSQHKLEEAARVYEEALAIARGATPVEPLDIATALHNLAAVRHSQNRLDEAETIAREALDFAREALPVGHPDLATSLGGLASTLEANGKAADAEPLYREALQIHREALPAGHPSLGVANYNFGWLLLGLGRADEADAYLREGLAITVAARPPGYPQRIAMEDSYATLQLATASSTADPSDWATAEVFIRECLSIREQTWPGDWSTYHCRSMLGEALLGMGRTDEAETMLLDGCRGLLERRADIRGGRDRVFVPRAIERLVRHFEAKGDPAEAAVWRGQLESETSGPPASQAGSVR